MTSNSNAPVFFILSTGRSGTVTVAELLSTIDSVTSLHEPEPQLIIESSGFRSREVSEEEIEKILRETRPQGPSGSIYCEVNQTLSLIIPILIKVFPSARFIWLLRNGLDVTASTYKAKLWYSGRTGRNGSYKEASPLQKAWIDGRIEGDRAQDVNPVEWESFSRFEKCAWYWGYVNRVIEEDLNRYAPDRFMILQLENLDCQFPDLIRWMGLNAVTTPLAQKHNKGIRPPYHWTEWSAEECIAFERHCGHLMDKFYPGWRTEHGYWQGVDYQSGGGFFSNLRRNYKLVSKFNAVFASNKH